MKTGPNFGKQLCDALGLDADITRDITISVPVADFIYVNVETLLRDEAGERFTGFMKRQRWKMELIEESEPVDLRKIHEEISTTWPLADVTSQAIGIGEGAFMQFTPGVES